MLPLRRYVEWLERVVAALRGYNMLTADPALADLIAEARQHDIGSTLAWEDADYLLAQVEGGAAHAVTTWRPAIDGCAGLTRLESHHLNGGLLSC